LPSLRQAVHKGLARLEEGATSYTTHRQCFSCHHQSLSIAAFVAGQKRGFAVSGERLKEQVEFTLATFREKHPRLRKGEDVGGRSTTVAYALFTLQQARHPADDTTDALVEYLLVRQEKDGSWPAVTQRNPSEGSRFTNAALALEAMKHYAPKDRTKDARAERIDAAFRKGAEWVKKNTPKDAEDRAFYVRSLATIGDDERLAEAKRDLVKHQLDDGSWRQIPTRSGDAYATAISLLALRQAGMKRDDVVYQKGIAYLLRTQTREGAWIVTTRSTPIQKWFDNGDPGGKSQFISFLATGWSTLALLDAIPER
jgi:N-acyl-D-amino-acid deacylase